MPDAVDGRFQTTQWTLVFSAASVDPSAQHALDALCRLYWLPVYAFIRRQGHSPADAEDLTQSFFSRVIEKSYLAQADRARGRIRSFLLASVKHFLSNERDRAGAQKRGGGIEHVTIGDSLEIEERLTPEEIFEKRSALALIEAALARLREEYAQRGSSSQFDALVPLLTGDADRGDAMSGATRVALSRMRVRYRAILRQIVASVVDEAGKVDDELRHLRSVVSL